MTNFKLKANTSYIDVLNQTKIHVAKVTLQGVHTDKNEVFSLTHCLNNIKDKKWIETK